MLKVLGPIIAGVIMLVALILPILHSRGVFSHQGSRMGQRARAKVIHVSPEPARTEMGLVDVKLVLEMKPRNHGVIQVRARRSVPAADSSTTFREGQMLNVQIASE